MLKCIKSGSGLFKNEPCQGQDTNDIPVFLPISYYISDSMPGATDNYITTIGTMAPSSLVDDLWNPGGICCGGCCFNMAEVLPP